MFDKIHKLREALCLVSTVSTVASTLIVFASSPGYT